MGKRLASARLTKFLQAKISDHFYGDTATVVQVASVDSLDVYGQPTVTNTSTSISCSFTDKPSLEKWMNFTDITQIEAEIRYDGTPAPANGDQFTLTGRFDGTEYTDTTFEVIGIQDRDNFGVLVALKKVEI